MNRCIEVLFLLCLNIFTITCPREMRLPTRRNRISSKSKHQEISTYESQAPDIQIVRRTVEIGFDDESVLYLLPELEASPSSAQSFRNPAQVRFEGLPDQSSASPYIQDLIPSIMQYTRPFGDQKLEFQKLDSWHNCSWMLDLEQDLLLTGCPQEADTQGGKIRSRIYVYKLDDSAEKIDILRKTDPQPYEILKCFDFAYAEDLPFLFALCEIVERDSTPAKRLLTVLTLNKTYGIVNSSIVLSVEQVVDTKPVFEHSRMVKMTQNIFTEGESVSKKQTATRLLIFQRRSWNITTLAIIKQPKDTSPPLLDNIGEFSEDEDMQRFTSTFSLECLKTTESAVRILVRKQMEKTGLDEYHFVEFTPDLPKNETSKFKWELTDDDLILLASVDSDSVLNPSLRIKRIITEDGKPNYSYTYVTLTQSAIIYGFMIARSDEAPASILIGNWVFRLTTDVNSTRLLERIVYYYENWENEVIILGLDSNANMIRVYLDTENAHLFVQEGEAGPGLQPEYAIVLDNPSFPNKLMTIWRESNGTLLIQPVAVHQIVISTRRIAQVQQYFPPYPVPFTLAARFTLEDKVTKECIYLELAVHVFQLVNAKSTLEMGSTFNAFIGQKSYIPILPIYYTGNAPVFGAEVLKVSGQLEGVTATVKTHQRLPQLGLPKFPIGRIERFTSIGGIYFRLQTRGSSMIIGCIANTKGVGKATCIRLFDISFDPGSEVILSVRFTNGFILAAIKFFSGSLRRLQFRIYDLQGGLVSKSALYEYDISELFIRDDTNGDIVVHMYGSKVESSSWFTQSKSIYYCIITLGPDRKVYFPNDMTLYRALPVSVSVKQLYWTPSISFNVLTLVLQGLNSKPSVMTILNYGKSSEVTPYNSFVVYTVDLLPVHLTNSTKTERLDSCIIGENPVIFLMASQQIVTVQRLEGSISTYSKIALPFAEYGMTRIIDYACLRDDEFLQVLAEKITPGKTDPSYYLLSYSLTSVQMLNSRVHSVVEVTGLTRAPRHLTAGSGLGLSGVGSQEKVVSIIATSAFEEWVVFSFDIGAPLLEIQAPSADNGPFTAVVRFSMTPFGANEPYKVTRDLSIEILEHPNSVIVSTDGTNKSLPYLRDNSEDLCAFTEMERRPSEIDLDTLLGLRGSVIAAYLEHISPEHAIVRHRVIPSGDLTSNFRISNKMMNVRSRHGCVLVWNNSHLFIFEKGKEVLNTIIYTGIQYLGFPAEAAIPVIIIKSDFTGERSLFTVIYRDPGNQAWVQVSAVSNIDQDFIKSSVLTPVVLLPESIAGNSQPRVASFYCVVFGYQSDSQYMFKSVLKISGQAIGTKAKLELETKLLIAFDAPISAMDVASLGNIAHLIVATRRSAQIHVIFTDRVMENIGLESFSFEPLKTDAMDSIFTCNLASKSNDNLSGRILCLLSTHAVESFKFCIDIITAPAAPFVKCWYEFGPITSLQNLQGFNPVRGSISAALVAIQSQNTKAYLYTEEEIPNKVNGVSNKPSSKAQNTRSAIAGEETAILLYTDNRKSSSPYDSHQAIAVITISTLQSIDPTQRQRVQGVHFDIEPVAAEGKSVYNPNSTVSSHLVMLIEYEDHALIKRFSMSNLSLQIKEPSKIHRKKARFVLQGVENTISVGFDQIFKPNWTRIILAWSILLLISAGLFIAGACILKHKGDEWFNTNPSHSRGSQLYDSSDYSVEPDLGDDKLNLDA